MPAFFIINRSLWIPLRDLVGFTIVSASGKIIWQLYMKGCGDDYGVARGEGSGQYNLDDVYMLRMVLSLHGFLIDTKVQSVDITPLFIV
jgi:hypothetical protein